MRSPAVTLLLVALLAGACQTAGDQLVDLPPTDRESVSDESSSEPVSCDFMLDGPPPLHPSVDDYGTGVVELDDGGAGCPTYIPVLIADTPAERSHGLMEVPEVPPAVGMWFTGYAEDRTGGFYMFGTLTDLDIAYVAADGEIVDIVEMVVCTEDDPGACPTYPPAAPYRTTLEVTPGWFDEVGIAVGDRVTLVEG